MMGVSLCAKVIIEDANINFDWIYEKDRPAEEHAFQSLFLRRLKVISTPQVLERDGKLSELDERTDALQVV